MTSTRPYVSTVASTNTVQDQFQTTKMADLLHQVIVLEEVQDAERAFIESRDMF